jgi:hypothetical protein
MGNDALMEEAEADLANNNDPNNNAEEFADAANQEPELVSIHTTLFLSPTKRKISLECLVEGQKVYQTLTKGQPQHKADLYQTLTHYILAP